MVPVYNSAHFMCSNLLAAEPSPMQRRLLNALLIALLVSFGLHGGPTQAQAQSTPKMQSGEGRPYEIADSEVWDVPDPVSGRGYQVYVALPPSYAKQPQRRYPVFMLPTPTMPSLSSGSWRAA
jgi:hypothetical protein